jgi:hypothetical protein
MPPNGCARCGAMIGKVVRPVPGVDGEVASGQLKGDERSSSNVRGSPLSTAGYLINDARE